MLKACRGKPSPLLTPCPSSAPATAGDVFPIHGTCLGFQLLHILQSNISRNYLPVG